MAPLNETELVQLVQDRDNEIKILKDQIARQQNDIIYYKALAQWYKEVRDKAVELADNTVKQFSRGV